VATVRTSLLAVLVLLTCALIIGLQMCAHGWPDSASSPCAEDRLPEAGQERTIFFSQLMAGAPRKPSSKRRARNLATNSMCFGETFKDVFGPSFNDLPADGALRRRIFEHEFKTYRVITWTSEDEPGSVQSGSWMGSFWLPEPPTRKAVLMALVKVRGDTVDNWAYLNFDGSISKKFLTPQGRFVGVLTIAPSGTILIAFDLDGDRMVDVAEFLADGRHALWIAEDRIPETIRIQADWQSLICSNNGSADGQAFKPGLRLPASANANEVICGTQTRASGGASDASRRKSTEEDLLDERCEQILQRPFADAAMETTREILACLQESEVGAAGEITGTSIAYDHILDSVFLADLDKGVSLGALEEVEPAGPAAPSDAGSIGDAVRRQRL